MPTLVNMGGGATSLASIIRSIKVTQQPNKMIYAMNEAFDTTGLQVSAFYAMGNSSEITNWTTSPADGDPITTNPTTVTVSANDDKGNEHHVTFQVVCKYVTGIAVTTPPNKTKYKVGENLDTTGMVVTATYSNGDTAIVTPVVSANGQPVAKGTSSFNISYTQDGVTVTTSQDITAIYPTSLSVTSVPTKTKYKVGETFDDSNMIVTAMFSDSSTTEVVTASCAYDTTTPFVKTDDAVAISYTGYGETVATSQAVTVIYPTSIAVSTGSAKSKYKVGEAFDSTGMVVTATFSDNITTEDVTASCTLSPDNGDTLTKSATEIAVSYTGYGETCTTTQAITMIWPTSLSLATAPTKTKYKVGETFDGTGMTVTATFSDGTTTENVTSSATYDSSTALVKGATTHAIEYTGYGETVSCNANISVIYPTSIAVTTNPTKMSYAGGEALNLSGMVITATFSDNSTTEVVNYTSSSPANGATLAAGQNTRTVTITYTGYGETCTTSFDVSMVYPTAVALKYTPANNNSYIADQQLDLTPSSGTVTYTITYNNGSTSDVTSGVTVSPAIGTQLTSSHTKYTLSYTGGGTTVTHDYDLTIKYVTSIAVTTEPTKKTYFSGESFDKTGMVVTATYSDSSTGTISNNAISITPSGALSTSNSYVTISYTNNGTAHTTTQSVTVTNPIVSWATGTGAEIKQMMDAVDAGQITLAGTTWAVGNERSVHLAGNINEDVKFVVEDIGGTTSGGTAYHFAVGQKNGLSATRQMNSSDTNSGGYNSSAMKTFIEGDYQTALQNATTGNFWEAVKSATHKSQIYSSGLQSTTAKVILHSIFEFCSSYTYAGDETTANGFHQFSWYTTTANRIKTQGEGGSANYVWTRSALTNSSGGFCRVHADGSAAFDYRASFSYLAAPFCVI